MDNASDAIQVFGGHDFMNDYAVGRFHYDAKILEIGVLSFLATEWNALLRATAAP